MITRQQSNKVVGPGTLLSWLIPVSLTSSPLLIVFLSVLSASWKCVSTSVGQSREPIKLMRRLILNDDGSGQMSAFKPPVGTSDLNAMVDKVAGTGVTTLSVALLDGHVVWHNSKVTTQLAGVQDPQFVPSFHRMISVSRSLHQQKIDPLRVFVDQAHEKGLEFFASLRMNDGHFAYYRGPNGSGPWASGHASKFWKEHQDLLLHGEDGYWRHLYDYAKDGTRKYRLSQIEEVCRNYDVDGFEMDFMRTPHYFRKGEEGEKAHLMTDLVSQVRKMMIEVGRAKGKRVLLMATVPRTIDECEQIGLNVRSWIKQGLIDLVVAKSYIYFEQDLPVKEWMALVQGSGVKFYAGFEHGDTVETFRAGVAKYFRDGADGIYLYNFWSFGLPYNPLGRQILREVGDPKLLKGQDKHYALLGGGPCAVTSKGDPQPPPTQVPAQVPAGGSKTFSIDIAEDIRSALKAKLLKNVTLRLTTDAKVGDLEFVLSGKPINRSLWTVRDTAWQVMLTQPPMAFGVNPLKVVNQGRVSRTISSVETLVHYKDSRPAASLPRFLADKRTTRDTRYAMEEGPWKRLKSECPSVPLRLLRKEWVKATVNIASTEALALAKSVRFEFRTPQTNTRDYQWWELYNAQPWETDRYEFKVNGHAVVNWEFIQRGAFATDYWIWGIRFDVPAEWLTKGDNTIEMKLKERESQIGWGLTFVHVDLFKQ